MYAQLIRDIQAALANPQLPIEFIENLASEFTEACDKVNQELTYTQNLLTAGYRDEAIQLADQAPQLLDLVAQLDFPESEIWSAVMVQRGLEAPPKLLVDRATQLELAYDQLRTLEPLLKTHRLLALAQAPLQSRIMVLRKLAKHDPTNPIWSADQEVLEKTRLAQIEQEFRRARSQADSTRLAELTAELQQPWSIPIPRSLRNGVADESSHLDRDRAREQLQTVASRLNDCLLEFDAATARPLREQWNRLNQTAQLDAADPLVQSVVEPLGWLEDLDREQASEQEFDRSINLLEAAVDERLPISQLENRIYQAQKFEREIPEHLWRRVQLYREDQQLSGKRKSNLRLVIAVVGLVLVASGIFWFVQRQSSQREIFAARNQLNTFVTDNDFDAGTRYFEGLPPALQSDAEIIRSHGKLQKNFSDEQNRVQRLAKLFQSLDLTGPLDDKFDQQIIEAETLVQSDAEKRQLEITKNNLKTARLERQSERTEAFLATLKPLQTQIETTVKRPRNMDSIEQLNNSIDSIEKLLAGSDQRIDGEVAVSGTIRQAAQSLIRRAQDRIAEIESSNQIATSLSRLAGNLDSFERYANAMQDFIERFPSDVNSPSFVQTQTEKNIWLAFQQWQSLARETESVALNSLTPEEAAAMFAKLKSATQNLELTQWRDSIRELGVFLSQERTTVAMPDGLLKRIKETFEQEKYTNIQSIQRGQEFYYLSEPFVPGKKTFKYFAEGTKTKSTSLLESDSVKQAPHCQTAKRLGESLNNADAQSPSQLVNELIELVLTADAAIDPLVQIEMLDQLLLFGKYSVPEFKDFADAQRKELAHLIGKDWKAHNETGALDARKDAPPKLIAFRQHWKSRSANKEQDQAVVEDLKQWTELNRFRPVGFLYQESDQWAVGTKDSIADGDVLYCLIPLTGNQAELKQVGEYDTGTLANMQNPNLLQAGRPVFVFPTSTNK